ncbi:dTDP-4-dehydrorhamnose reductase [Granulicella arctica]|uniref:dTDP-4-dehydrorhamnose reductase n=1 Tax=Granulicella arctica TaxID=940613 RepID=UPI0021E0BB61|nr:dTDP-4-dehydrorhamnose reductase [Granulicella arctica]
MTGDGSGDQPRILLTGATGQVGGQLLRTLSSLGTVIAPCRSEMDLSQSVRVREVIRAVQPRWIVNPGAYTAVDKAESEPELAYAVNQSCVAAIGEEAKKIGAAVIHFSTDYVFSGAGSAPYRETDATLPTSVYGASKLAGEQALAASGAAYLIFRTSWVYGSTGKNFLLTILKLARERESLRIVADQHGAPTSSEDLARMVVSVISQCEASARREGLAITDSVSKVSGLYHAAGTGETTWHGFAREAVHQMSERQSGARYASIDPIATEDYPTPAKRPANSRLDCSKLADSFGWRMPEWQESLGKVIGDIPLPS